MSQFLELKDWLFNSFLPWQVWFMGQFSHIFDDFDEVRPFELLFLKLFDDSMEFL
jgi:hypothetical protein